MPLTDGPGDTGPSLRGGALPPVAAGLYGAVVIGGLTLAVSIDAIREVVPRPATLLPFPAVRDDILGAIDLRGAIVPVLDPVGLLSVPCPGFCPVVLVLRCGNGVVGLVIEAIAGVLPLGDMDLTQLDVRHDRGGRPSLMRAAFGRGEIRGMVLDIEALGDLEAMPFAVERLSTPTTSASAATGAPTLLFAVGSLRLGLAADLIEACVPEQAIAPGPIQDTIWLGWLTHNGRRIPVVDTMRLLQLGESEPAARTAAVIVRLPMGHLIGLRIDAVTDMRRIPDHEIKPLQRFMLGNHALFRGLYGEERPTLLLDSVALQADARLASFGKLYERSQTAAAVASARHQALQAFLLVRLGERRHAISLDQVDEIIATKRSGMALEDPGQGIADFIVHRGRGVPLIDLHLALALSSGPGIAPFTILASADGNQAGFMVDELCAVERAPVRTLRDAGSDKAIGRIAATITIADLTYPIIDLRALIDALCAPAEAA